MKMQDWLKLKDGDVIFNDTDGFNKIKQYHCTFYDDNLYLVTSDKDGNELGNSLFPLSLFDCEDWCLVEDGVIVNEI